MSRLSKAILDSNDGYSCDMLGFITDPTMLSTALGDYYGKSAIELQVEMQYVASLPDEYPHVWSKLIELHGEDWLLWGLRNLARHVNSMKGMEWDSVLQARREMLRGFDLAKLLSFDHPDSDNACVMLSKVAGVNFATYRANTINGSRNFQMWTDQTMEFGTLFMQECHHKGILANSKIPPREATRLMHIYWTECSVNPRDSLSLLLAHDKSKPLHSDQLFHLAEAAKSGVPLEYALAAI